MEISWKELSLCLGLLFFELCNGFPINLENTAADSHTQLLTGLVAVLLTVCSVVLLAGCLCCQRRNGFKEFRDSPVTVSTTSNLDHGHVNPVANGEFTIFTPLSPPNHNNNVFLANQQIITRTPEDYSYGDVNVSLWFNQNEKDFPRTKLKYIRELGKGWFGKVVEGAAQDLNTGQSWTPVAVRILDASAGSKERVLFLHDAAIYRIGNHPNILQMFGKCLDTAPLLLLQEYCHQGDLKQYLRENRSTAENLLSSEYPLVWCCQVTSALKHLHQNQVTHPDLATRNCQLTQNLTLKVGDYGLSVQKYPDDYYQGSAGVPVRWCAPESLTCTSTTIQPKAVTKESNIWSLGVTMWEICSCGEQPYASLSDDEVVSQVLGSLNIRLTRPSFSVYYTDYIFRLMQLCWTNAESRPAVAQIDLMLADLLQVFKNTTASPVSRPPVLLDDFDRRWDSFKPNKITRTDNHMVESTETDDSDIITAKTLSPSLNNLHGSLDNLIVGNEPQMDSWLENVASNTNDLSYVKGISEAINELDDALALENVSSSDSSHQQSPKPHLEHQINFKLGPTSEKVKFDPSNQNDSLTDSMLYVQRTSSESETEDENWKKKIERGAYTEKVRLKSRSVADLMVLTHIDCSESESETPLPSLDYRINYKNVRYAPKQNLENVSLTFGSEGNLLSVKGTFEEELKKLKEERRDSLLFVPDNDSQNNSLINQLETEEDENVQTKVVPNDVIPVLSEAYDTSASKRLLEELNSSSEIKPVNQVYNVFNVTIDKFSPIHHVHSPNLNNIIHFNEDCEEDKLSSNNKPHTNVSSDSKKDLPLESNRAVTSENDKEIIQINNSRFETSETEDINTESMQHMKHEKSQLGDDSTESMRDFTTVLSPTQNSTNIVHSPSQEDDKIVENVQNLILESEATLLEKKSELSEENDNKNKIVQLEQSHSVDLIKNVEIIETEVREEEDNKDETVDLEQTNSADISKHNNVETKTKPVINKDEDTGNTRTVDLDHSSLVDSIKNNDEESETNLKQVANDDKNTNNDRTEELGHHNSVETIKHSDEDTESNVKHEENELVDTDKERTVELEQSYIVELVDVEKSESNGKQQINEDNNTNNVREVEVECVQSELELDVVTNEDKATDHGRELECEQPGSNGIIAFDGSKEDKTAEEIETIDSLDVSESKDASNEEKADSQVSDSNEYALCMNDNNKTTNITPNKSSITQVEEERENVHRNSSFVENCSEGKVELGINLEVTQENNTNKDEEIRGIDITVDLKESQISEIWGTKENVNDANLETKTSENIDELEKNKKAIINFIEHESFVISNEMNTTITKQDNKIIREIPKLSDLIQNNDELMDYIISKYDNENPENDDNKEPLSNTFATNNVIPNNDATEINDSNDDTENTTFNKVVDEKNDLNNEMTVAKKIPPSVTFDLSTEQDEAMPNSLTHSTVFTSTPFGKKNMPDLLSNVDTYSSLNLFENEAAEADANLPTGETEEMFNKNLNYSLETWDNFLGKTLDNQSQENMFDSFSSEPQSLLFIESDNTYVEKDCDMEDKEIVNVNETFEKENVAKCENNTFVLNDGDKDVPEEAKNTTFDVCDTNATFVMNDKDATFSKDVDDSNIVEGNSSSWDAGGGWFLHPQSNVVEVSGEMVIPAKTGTDSYVGFSMDEDIMAAIRNELLTKLPQAQGAASSKFVENEELDMAEKNEVFLRYNVYNTPLSPIPEESFIEDNSGENTPRHHNEDEDDTDWSEACEPESHSAHTSPMRVPLHRHTPSQDSCCSNDTLFNLEELTCGVAETDKDHIEPNDKDIITIESPENEIITEKIVTVETNNNDENKNMNIETNEEVTIVNTNENESDVTEILENTLQENDGCGAVIQVDVRKETVDDFLLKEREFCSLTVVKVIEPLEPETKSDNSPRFLNKHVAPLPSPEDNPWKQLPASLLSYDKVISQSNGMLQPTCDTVPDNLDLPMSTTTESHAQNVPVDEPQYSNVLQEDELVYENVPNFENGPTYENINDIYNEADYVNIVNLENKKNSAEYINVGVAGDKKEGDFLNSEQNDSLIIQNDMDEDDAADIFGVLTDIRFNGPSDSQLMSTSFSESNDLNDEQDWDSGSDTRSSSSGEFIWKEGEHEESVKALRAAPQDVLEDVKPMEGILEETSSESSTTSTSDEDDVENPEFVPSAWDKYATPTKSALRSPEKTLEKSEHKKSRGVWFKKQKYHCVYEYPREPESPVLQSHDLWKPQSDYSTFGDWEFDADTALPTTMDDTDNSQSNYTYQPKSSRSRNLYQLTSISDFMPSNSGLDDEFYISSSAKPFDMIGGLSSQFFPGNTWGLENVTPDSGVEDITPGSLTDCSEFTNKMQLPLPRTVESLKKLASEVVNKNQFNTKSNDVMGGLRHTRNRLKLDLPPSPSAFTSSKMFTIEPTVDPVTTREKPTFSTFGKSRFLVQHVDTPPDDNKNKNVSFEAIPYKPIHEISRSYNENQFEHASEDIIPYNKSLESHTVKEDFDVEKTKGKVESVRGEASLLDSADEDSGIESSTLERKLST